MRITASLILTAFLTTTVACAPEAPEEPAQEVVPTTEDVTVTSELQNATSYAEVYATIKRISDGAKAVSGIYSGVTGAINFITIILRLIGVIDPARDRFSELGKQLDALGVSLSWQRAASDRDRDMAAMMTALNSIIMNFNEGGPPLTSLSGVITDAQTAVNNAEGLAAGSPFLRSFAEASTDGVINWKSVIGDRPTAETSPTVYDWRLGVPILMKLIALRLVVIGAVHPDFRTDHVFDAEINQHRNALLEQLRTMLGGVRCNNFTYLTTSLPGPGGLPLPAVAYGCNLACADVYSGIAGQRIFAPSWSQLDQSCPAVSAGNQLIDARNTLTSQVISMMPISQMQALIDRLYTFLHPGPDLTEALGRITNEDENLCIEVAGGSAAAGTPLQLAACNGTDAQRWSYNRQTGQIRNPALGTCIDVAGGNPLPNGTVHSWPCSDVAGDPPEATNPNQVWTYDPEKGRLQSVFGTVLKADSIAPGALLKTFLNVLPPPTPVVPFVSPTPTVTVQPGQERWLADSFRVAAGRHGDGRLDVVYTGRGNVLLHRAQTAPNDAFGAEALLNAPWNAAKQVATELNLNGLPEVFYIGTDDVMYHTWWNGTAWSGEFPLTSNSTRAKRIAVGRNSDGRLEVIFVRMDNILDHMSQTAPGDVWSNPVGLRTALEKAKDMVIARHADGRLALFYIGLDDGLYRTAQTSAGGAAWSNPGLINAGNKARQLAVGQNADGRLEVFYVGTNYSILHAWENTPNGAWSAENFLTTAGSQAKRIAVGRNADGRQEAFYIGMNDVLYHSWQTAPNAGWVADFFLATPSTTAREMTVGQNQDGRQELFFVDAADDTLHHTWQVTPNGGWSATPRL